MQIYLGADHRGYEMKNLLKAYLQAKMVEKEAGADGHPAERGASVSSPFGRVVDLGTFSQDMVDYPDIAREVSEKVQENPGTIGILICGSGVGVCMAANKMAGIRAALVTSVENAKHARANDWANVLCLGAEGTDTELAKQIVEAFLTTEPIPGDDGRYKRRAEKLDSMIPKN